MRRSVIVPYMAVGILVALVACAPVTSEYHVDTTLTSLLERNTTSDGTGIPGGVGGGTGYESHVIFYVGVPDVEAALQKAESLGGTRRLGPARAPTGLVVGHFTDPEGNLIGVAGTR